MSTSTKNKLFNSRVQRKHTARILSGLQDKMSYAQRHQKSVTPGLVGKAPSLASKKKRIEVVDITTDAGNKRWQELHNNTEAYEIISSKDSILKGQYGVEYTVIVVYYELGEDLPIARALNETPAEAVSETSEK
jgi:hypothetical protein